MLLFTHPYLTHYDSFLQKRVQDLYRLDQFGSIKLLEQGCGAVEYASLILKTAPLRERLTLSQFIKLIGTHPRLASEVLRIIAKLNGDQIVQLISDRADLADILSQANIRTKLNPDHIEALALHSDQNAKIIFDDELSDLLNDQVINQLGLIFPSIGRYYEQFPHLARMCLFKVNTGCREQEVCQMRWEWEIKVPELNTSVFIIPANKVKNREDRLVVLNRVAKSIVEEVRGKNSEFVFTYKGSPVKRINNSSWNRVRKQVGLQKARIHDLKHTFGRRLRAAGVPLETRKVLLGHRNGDITTHYSDPRA